MVLDVAQKHLHLRVPGFVLELAQLLNRKAGHSGVPPRARPLAGGARGVARCLDCRTVH